MVAFPYKPETASNRKSACRCWDLTRDPLHHRRAAGRTSDASSGPRTSTASPENRSDERFEAAQDKRYRNCAIEPRTRLHGHIAWPHERRSGDERADHPEGSERAKHGLLRILPCPLTWGERGGGVRPGKFSQQKFVGSGATALADGFPLCPPRVLDCVPRCCHVRSRRATFHVGQPAT
jgi:hypothetical protein